MGLGIQCITTQRCVQYTIVLQTTMIVSHPSQVQGNYGSKNQTVLQRMRTTVKERGGVLALYRGLGPGTIRSFIANGCSMIVMQAAQKQVSQWGLRD